MIITKRPIKRYFPERAGKEWKRFFYQEACYLEWLKSVGRAPAPLPWWKQVLEGIFG